MHYDVNYSFMKLFSQSVEALTQHCDVNNPELASKRRRFISHVQVVIERRKSKVKETSR